MIVVSGEFIVGWCIGVALYAAVLYATHLLVVRLERRRSGERTAFRSRLNKHVYRGFRWS